MRPFTWQNMLNELDAASLRVVAKYFRDHASEAESIAKRQEDRERQRKQVRRDLTLHPRLTKAEKIAAARRLRNIEITKHAARGWPDKKIAEKFGLHEKSISRIVRREIERQEAGWHGRRPD